MLYIPGGGGSEIFISVFRFIITVANKSATEEMRGRSRRRMMRMVIVAKNKSSPNKSLLIVNVNVGQTD